MSEVEKVRVHGVAIRSGTSRNNIKYLPEELQSFTPTLSDRPILKDHVYTTESAIGLVEDASYADEQVFYNGWVKEDGTGVVERIRDRRIKEVSVGAIARQLVRESKDSDVFIAKGITAMELSLTPTPGVQGTSMRQYLEKLKEGKMNNMAIAETDYRIPNLKQEEKRILPSDFAESTEPKGGKNMTDAEKADILAEKDKEIVRLKEELKSLEVAELQRQVEEKKKALTQKEEVKEKDQTQGKVATPTESEKKSPVIMEMTDDRHLNITSDLSQRPELCRYWRG
jgi:hypothetical protein